MQHPSSPLKSHLHHKALPCHEFLPWQKYNAHACKWNQLNEINSTFEKIARYCKIWMQLWVAETQFQAHCHSHHRIQAFHSWSGSIVPKGPANVSAYKKNTEEQRRTISLFTQWNAQTSMLQNAMPVRQKARSFVHTLGSSSLLTSISISWICNLTWIGHRQNNSNLFHVLWI